MTRLNLKIEIRRNADDAIATDVWPDWEYNTFWWKNGNASCDCNRGLFFAHAKGESDEPDHECSYGQYSVRLSNADTGAVLYDEFIK